MKVVFFIAKVGDNMQLSLLKGKYDTYLDAENAISDLPSGFYQVQKFFEVNKSEIVYQHDSKSAPAILTTQTFA